MIFPEPEGLFTQIQSVSEKDNLIVITDTTGAVLHVSCFESTGWQFEVRYDLFAGTKRQSFSGRQELLKKAALSISDSEMNIIITSPTAQVIFQKSDASFQIIEENGVLFQSNPYPFSHHKDPVDMPEKLVSIDEKNIMSGACFVGKSKTFQSHMARFQYPRPQGLVLGLPGQTGEMNRNGYRFELYNTDSFLHIPDRNPLYQSWPILFHQTPDGKGWIGIFHDNPSRTFVDIGDFYDESITFESQTGNSRVYIVTGTSLQEVSQKIVGLLGVPVFPPLWAFGYQQSRWSYMNTKELRDVITHMREGGYPLDALYLDIDFMDNYKVFTVNQERFSDLGTFLAEAKNDNIHCVCIVDPGIKIENDYNAYTELKTLNGYLKKEDDEPLVGTVWPGEVLFPDFFNEKTQDWWSKKTQSWLEKYPFDGLWNDMNEPADFLLGNALFAESQTSNGPLRNEYNLYGYRMAQAAKTGWDLHKPNERGLIITRSGYPGVQQHSTIWHGDNQPWWEHLQLALRHAISYSLCGAFYTGPDVPGFFGNTPDDLVIRFYQLGAFLPFFRGHTAYFTQHKEPYSFTAKTREHIKTILELRYSLLRVWYGGFEQSVREKTSPLLPVLSEKNELIQDQYILFNTLLFAPVVERDQTKKLIYLPEGAWYELGNTDKRIDGNQWITRDITIESIPVYVKEGTILPRNVPGENTKETLKNNETYEIYPDKQGLAEGYWFNDDGISVNSKATRVKLRMKNGQVIKEEITT